MHDLEFMPVYRESDTGRTVQFVPVRNVPGFSHRVVVDGYAVGWLDKTFRPSAKTARFFLDKYPPLPKGDDNG